MILFYERTTERHPPWGLRGAWTPNVTTGRVFGPPLPTKEMVATSHAQTQTADDFQEARAWHRIAGDLERTHPHLMTELRRTKSGLALLMAWASIPHLCDEITRLHAALRETRLSRADMIAAARATITADREGEPDPLWYLHDELTAQNAAPTYDGRAGASQ